MNKKIFFWLLLAPKLLIFLLSTTIPKNKQIRVYGYGGGNGFTDNTKYLYLYSNEYVLDVRSVWLTKNKEVKKKLNAAGYEAYHFSSIRGNYLSLRAGVFYVTHSRLDIPWWCSARSNIIRLNHGIPFKKFGWDDKNAINSMEYIEKIARKYIFVNYSHSIATSKYYQEILADALMLDRERIAITGLPRMDLFYNKIQGYKIYTDRETLELVSNNKNNTIFYFPTWRRNGSDNVEERIDLEKIDQILENTEYKLIIANHIGSKYYPIDNYENIKLIEENKDFYPVLLESDIMITDYSSLFYDCLYYDIPIVFYAPDYNEYIKTREFYFEYRDVPGKIITNPSEFEDLLDKIVYDDEELKLKSDNYHQWQNKVYNEIDAKNCRRVLNDLP